jgi:hypothetical protein
MVGRIDKLAHPEKLFNPGGGFYIFFLKSTKSGPIALDMAPLLPERSASGNFFGALYQQNGRNGQSKPLDTACFNSIFNLLYTL